MTEDLSNWRELRRIGNSYLAWDEISREAALFDIGDVDATARIIEAEGLQLRHVFLTSEQPAKALRARSPKARLHTSSRSAPPQDRNRPNDFIHLGSLRITNRAYGEEGVIYIIGNWPEDAPHVVLLGDPNRISKEALRDQVLTLPPEALLCPAQGSLATVSETIARLAAGQEVRDCFSSR